MEDIVQDLAMRKNRFYRDSYRTLLGLVLLLSLIAAALSVILAFTILIRIQPSSYASTTNGVLIPLQPLSEPVVSTSYLLEWSSMAARAAYNLDFVDYQKQLDFASQYFSSSAWSKFLSALDDTGLLATVKEKKLVMHAIVSGPAVVLHSDYYHGRFMWRVQFPMLVSYGSASEERRMKLIITMNVARVSVLDTPKGIQVTDFASTLS